MYLNLEIVYLLPESSKILVHICRNFEVRNSLLTDFTLIPGTVIIGSPVETAVAQWLRCYATNRRIAGSIAAGVTEFFIDIKSFRSHYGPGVDSASNRNKYQKYFLRVKTGGV